MESPGGDADDRSETGSQAGSVNGVASHTNGNVQVVVRVRPPNEREKDQGYIKTVSVDPSETCLFLKEKAQSRPFTFDYVADEATSQDTMFQRIGRPIAESCLQGYHCCLLAYGQTGAGKTFTMEGPTSDYVEDGHLTPGLRRASSSPASELRGLIPRVLDYIFNKTAQEKEMNGGALDYAIKCSYLQIYNENVSDLLDPEQTNLTIREDVKRGHYVDGLQEVVVPNAEACYGTLRRGSANRHVGMTAMNAESSRSHAVFTVVVESQRRGEKGMMTKRVSRFYLVDLAGSERQKHSEAMGTRLKEAGGINKSLSALGNVIKALVDTGEGKVRHVPYRDSKLTFLLKDALGGNSKCSLVANISPAEKNAEETLSTLKFAQRAKMMRNTATVNEDCFGNPATMGEEIKRLRLEIAVLKANMGNATVVELAAVPPPMDEAEASQAARLTFIIQQSSKRHLWLERNFRKELDDLTRQLAAEKSYNERLNSAVQAHKMIIKLREANIKRLEANRPPTDVEMAHDVKEEMESLRRQVDVHPDAVKFSMEVDLLRAQVQQLMNERDDDEDVSARLEQTETLYKNVASELEVTLVQTNKLKAELAAAKRDQETARVEQEAYKQKIAALEEQAKRQQEAIDVLSAESAAKDNKYEKLEAKYAKLEPTHKEIVAQLEDERHQKDVLEVKLFDTNKRVNHVQKEADKYSSAYTQQNKLQEDLMTQLENLSHERDAARKEVGEATAKLGTINALEAQLAELKAGKADVEEKFKCLGAEKDEADRLSRVAQQASADLRTTISDLREQLNALNEQLLTAVQEKNESVRARSAAEAQNLTLTAAQAELKKAHKSAEEQLNKVNEQLLLSTQEKNALVRARTIADARTEELTASEAEAKKQLESVTGQLTEAASEKTGLVEQLRQLQGEKEEVEKRHSQLAAEKAEGEAQLGAEISQLNVKVEGLDLKADELEKKLRSQKERLGVLTGDKEAAEKRIAELLSVAAEKEATVSKLRGQVVQLEGALSDMARQKDELREQVVEHLGKAEAAEVRYTQAQSEAESIRTELDHVRKEKASADEFQNLLMIEKQQLKEAHESSLKAKGDLEDSLREKEKAVQAKEADLVKLAERIASLEKETGDNVAALSAASAEAAASLSKLQAVELELQKAQDGRLTAEGALEEATKEVQGLKQQMESLKQDLRDAKLEASKLTHKVIGLEGETKDLHASLAEEKDARTAAEQSLEECNEQHRALFLSTERLVNSEAEAKALVATCEARVLEVEADLRKVGDENVEEIAALQRQLAVVENEQRVLLEHAQEANEQAAQLETEFVKMEEERQGLAKRLSEAEAEAETMRAEASRLAADMEGLEAARSELLSRVDSMEAHLDTARAEAADKVEALNQAKLQLAAEKDALVAEHLAALSTLNEAARATEIKHDALLLEHTNAIGELENAIRAAEKERDGLANAVKEVQEGRAVTVSEHGAAVASLKEGQEALMVELASAEEALRVAEKEREMLVAGHPVVIGALEEAVRAAEDMGTAKVAAALERKERECADNLATLEEKFEERGLECAATLCEKERLLEERERGIEMLKEKGEKLAADWEVKVAALEVERIELVGQIAPLKQEAVRLRLEKTELAGHVADCGKTAVRLGLEKAELVDKPNVVAQEHAAQVQEAEDQWVQLEQKVLEEKGLRSSSRQLAEDMRYQGDSVRSQLTLVTVERDESQAELAAMAEEVAAVEARLAQSEVHKAALEKDLAAERTQIELLKRSQKETEAARIVAGDKLEEAQKLVVGLRTDLVEKQTAVESLGAALAERETALEEASLALATAVAEGGVLQEEAERLRMEIAVLEGSISAFEEQLGTLETEKMEVKEQCTRLGREAEQLKGDLAAARASLEVAGEDGEMGVESQAMKKQSKEQLKSGDEQADCSLMSPGADIRTATPLDTPSPKAAARVSRALPEDALAASARLKKIVAARAASVSQRQPLGSLQTNNVDSKRRVESPVQKVRYSLRSRLKPDETSPTVDSVTTKRSRLI